MHRHHPRHQLVERRAWAVDKDQPEHRLQREQHMVAVVVAAVRRLPWHRAYLDLPVMAVQKVEAVAKESRAILTPTITNTVDLPHPHKPT